MPSAFMLIIGLSQGTVLLVRTLCGFTQLCFLPDKKNRPRRLLPAQRNYALRITHYALFAYRFVEYLLSLLDLYALGESGLGDRHCEVRDLFAVDCDTALLDEAPCLAL